MSRIRHLLPYKTNPDFLTNVTIVARQFVAMDLPEKLSVLDRHMSIYQDVESLDVNALMMIDGFLDSVNDRESAGLNVLGMFYHQIYTETVRLSRENSTLQRKISQLESDAKDVLQFKDKVVVAEQKISKLVNNQRFLELQLSDKSKLLKDSLDKIVNLTNENKHVKAEHEKLKMQFDDITQRFKSTQKNLAEVEMRFRKITTSEKVNTVSNKQDYRIVMSQAKSLQTVQTILNRNITEYVLGYKAFSDKLKRAISFDAALTILSKSKSTQECNHVFDNIPKNVLDKSVVKKMQTLDFSQLNTYEKIVIFNFSAAFINDLEKHELSKLMRCKVKETFMTRLYDPTGTFTPEIMQFLAGKFDVQLNMSSTRNMFFNEHFTHKVYTSINSYTDGFIKDTINNYIQETLPNISNLGE